jgi:hypothetical protein
MEVSKEEEINQLSMGKPHLVILGAGASLASFQNGDKNGKRLPIMNNFIETLCLEDLINSSGMKFDTNNFEEIYSQLYSNPDTHTLREQLEQRIYDYFSDLELYDTPTIYDHLVLSLREKDVIATFNWDPFLVQAYRRNGRYFKLPKLIFLHGNVEVGYCPNGHIMGNIGQKCSQCNELLLTTKLLYPIGEKNYHQNEFISRQWTMFQDVLNHAFMITIFGYGAPSSDASAIELMKSAWGNVEDRMLEETEIIDIRDEDELRELWDPFIHSHHYRIKNSFYDSWIANHPRRTGEAYINQFIEAKFIENNPIPKDMEFKDLWQWFDRLKQVEETN